MLVHVHGVLMSLWVLLFVGQVWLIAARHVTVHQCLGWVGVGLAVGIVLAGIPTALRSGKYGSASTPPAIVPVFDLIMFVVFFSAAIYFRRRPVAHRAMMLMTVLNFLPPALGRIPLGALHNLGPLWFFGLPAALGLLAVMTDARTRGHVSRYLLAGLIVLVAADVVRLGAMNSAAWLQFATWATSFV